MSDLIDKIKNNLGLTIDVIIALVAVAVIAYVFLVAAPGIRDEVKKTEREIRQLANLQQASVVVPSVEPGQDDETLSNLTINPKINEQMQALAQRIDGELVNIREYAIERNRQGHEWLLNNLFPAAASADMPHNARGEYLRRLGRLFGPATDDQPGLDAGMPPTQQVLDDAVARVRDNAIADKLGPTFTDANTASLDEAEVKSILEKMRTEYNDLLQQRAAGIHIYAQSNITASDYPFSVVPISDEPTMAELWEAQFQLWIITDLVQAIGIANDVQNPGRNVMNSTVKRLLDLRVVPGYVGIHVPGAVMMTTTANRSGGGNTTTVLFDKPAIASAGTDPSNEDTGAGEMIQANDQIRTTDNFYITPTGRVSNLLYDVRHVKLKAVVDFQKLPQLLDAINQINLMTVLSIDMTNVDEYEAYQQGFVYGPGDMVEVDMVIETIWLRLWTLEKMPDDVKIALGLIRNRGEQTTPEDFGNVWGGGNSWENQYQNQ